MSAEETGSKEAQHLVEEYANSTGTQANGSIVSPTSPVASTSLLSPISPAGAQGWQRIPERSQTMDSIEASELEGLLQNTRLENGSASEDTRPPLPTYSSSETGESSLPLRRGSYQTSERTDSPLSRNGDSTAEVIGFHPIDPITKLDLVDPVLCSDGLMHDRWSIILSGKPYKHQILGEVKQLREAIFSMWPERKAEYQSRRDNFKKETLQLCTNSTGYAGLSSLLWSLDHVLLWEPKSTALLIRRGVVRYRLRDLQGSLEDLTKAVDLSRRHGAPINDWVDALCYRAMVKETCNDRNGALLDVDEALARQHRSIGFVIRAGLRASLSQTEEALEDLDSFEIALSTNIEEDELARENKDLEMLVSGWARSAVGQIPEALACFHQASQYRLSPNPYILASLGLAQVLVGQTGEGQTTLNAAIEQAQDQARRPLLASSSKSSLRPVATSNLMIPFDLYLLRGMSFYITGAYHEALNDFEKGIALRPSCVQDTGELRYVLACLRAETGDLDQAMIDFDWACALRPDQRESYIAERDRLMAL